MAENLIDAIPPTRVADPDGGANLSVPTRPIVIEPSLEGREADLDAGLDFGSQLASSATPTPAQRLADALRNPCARSRLADACAGMERVSSAGKVRFVGDALSHRPKPTIFRTSVGDADIKDFPGLLNAECFGVTT